MKKLPFPQANNMDLMFSVLLDIGNDGISKTDVAVKYSMNERQGSYYLDALLYLGFLEKIHSKYFLTQKGINVRLAPQDCIKKEFIQQLLKHPFIYSMWIDTRKMNKTDASIFIESSIFNEYSTASSTTKRRASSIISWFEWIEKNMTQEECNE